MDELRIDPVVISGDAAERIAYPDDEIWIRAAGHGDLQVADYTSADREGPPMHRHPWDEAQTSSVDTRSSASATTSGDVRRGGVARARRRRSRGSGVTLG